MLKTDRPILSAVSCRFPTAEGPVNLKSIFAESGKPGPRRVNRLIQLAVLGARRCVGERTLPSNTAVYLTSRSAHVADSLLLLERIRAGQPSSPVSFINTSGNMAGYYIAADLGLRGSNQSIHATDLAWSQMLEMAVAAADPQQYLLIGCAEECVWPLEQHRNRHELPADCRIDEQSCFVLLGPVGAPGPRRLQSVEFKPTPPSAKACAPLTQDAGLAAPGRFVDWLQQPQRPRQFIESPAADPGTASSLSGFVTVID